MIKLNTLGLHKDNLLGVNYRLELVESATELSDLLKSVLKKNSIDYDKYNSYNQDSINKDTAIANPPKEIYEYQNFFVLERANGDIVLLDGFRRLLWYTPPSTPILVRFYKEEDLTSQKILTLLVNLNHFKFFSNQSYHERGFSLLLKTVFDIDITKFRKTFDAYLSSKETKNSYSSYGNPTGQDKNIIIKDRIANEFFISDIKFLEKLSTTKYLADQYMGALLFELRTESKKQFDVDKFISLIESNKVLLELMEKYKKTGTDHSAKSQEVVNKIIEMYRNIFIIMEGGKIEKSFAEKQQETKELVEKLKKDKTLVKLTGHKKVYDIEREMDRKLANGEHLEFVCVVHPNEKDSVSNDWNNNKVYNLPYGLCNEIQYLKHTPKHLGMNTKHINIGLMLDGIECRIRHNFGGGKQYTLLDMPYGSQNYNVDLFVRMEVVKEVKSTTPKTLKEFYYYDQNHSKKRKLFVLAWTQKEAREMFNFINVRMTDSEMRNYVYQSWGNNDKDLLKDQDLSSPCIYSIDDDKKITLVLKK